MLKLSVIDNEEGLMSCRFMFYSVWYYKLITYEVQPTAIEITQTHNKPAQ